MKAQPQYGFHGSVILGVAITLAGGERIALAQPPAKQPRAAISLWDTGKSSAEPLAAQAVEQKNGWQAIENVPTPKAFQGDAVVSNGRVLAIARRDAPGVELYSLGLGKPNFRTRLLLTPATGIERVIVTERSGTEIGLEVESKSGRARFRLKKGEPYVEVQAVSGEATLRVECPSRFAVLPDFFADDILFDPRKVSLDKVELPSENFLLLFTGKQDALVMSVFENRAQDVRVTLAGKGQARALTGSEISFGKQGNKIWVAVLEGAGMWHALDVRPVDAKKILPLDWKMPFTAQWRVDFTRHDGLTDSWDMLLPDKDGPENGFIKPSWLTQDGKMRAAARTRTGAIDDDAYATGWIASQRLDAHRNRWTTVLGWFEYPCWSDRSGKGFLQPLAHKKLAFDGAVLIYPITRLAETPIARYTPVDVMRNTLGIGPCQHLLDVEGQKEEHVGRATCHVWRLLTGIYRSGEQQAKRKEIETYLGDALEFVTHIRNRIARYVAFGKDLRKYLAEQRTAHPELKENLDALDALAGAIDERVEPRMQTILTNPTLKKIAAQLAQRKDEPTPPALAAQLNRNFLTSGLIDYTGADWQAKLDTEYCNPLTLIGGEQDETVGECRWVVKALRQKAGILMAADPRMASIAAEIRARTQKMLRGGAAYEGARH
jgi:hypothetical protein